MRGSVAFRQNQRTQYRASERLPMNSIPTKHQHWVPKFYLAKFATPETRAKAMDKRRISAMSKQLALISPQPTSVRNFCGERYLYAPLDPSGERSMEVENLLGRVETRASAVWDEFAVERSDLRDPQLREILAQFVATLHLGNKVVLDLISSTMALRDKLYGEPSQEVLAKRGPGGPDATHPGRFFVHTLVNGFERMTATFSEKRWLIFARTWMCL